VLILYFGLLVILNMLADIAVQYLDPRTRNAGKEVR
jgi:ABC-type dipeptide/oligopeptide/nickel transport system permease component